MEEWRDIKGFEGFYQISNYGLIKGIQRKIYRDNFYTIRKEKILKKSLDKDAYEKIILSKLNKDYTFQVHRLIGSAFLNNPTNLPTINHKNKIKSNNFVLNLEWASHRENSCHRSKMGEPNKIGGYFNPKENRWYSYIYINKTTFYLGSFETQREANIAYKKALKQHGISNKYA